MEKIKLIDSICPTSFDFYEDKIYYFDKPNKHEGLFCCQEDGKKVIEEVLDGFGLVRKNIRIFYRVYDNKTDVYIKSDEEKRLLLDGVFFDFHFYGNYLYCLGRVSDISVIKVLNQNLNEVKNIYIADLLFTSTFLVMDNYLYIAGFDKDNNFKVIKINYFGKRIEGWDINYKSRDEIIAKIFIIQNNFVLHITGKKDKILIYDFDGKNSTIIYPQKFGLDAFVDVQVYDDKIFVLNKDLIYEFNFKEFLYGKEWLLYNLQTDILKYKYLLYSVGLKKDLIIDFSFSLINSFIIVLVTHQRDFKLFLSIFGINYFIISNILNFTHLLFKDERINRILEIFDYNINLTLVPFSFFIYFSSIFNLYFKFKWQILIMLFFLILGDYYICRSIKGKKFDYAVELLEYKNEGLRLYIMDRIEELLKLGKSKVFVSISIDKLNSDILARYQKTRKVILRDGFSYQISNNIINSTIDFTKRDIRYSRFSILMDYFSFIRNYTKINEIRILPENEQNEENK
ncbi:hypothetical protein [Caloramator australicus]|uniref:Uncharacterized protein n=1 Tax=Caloramator australicus RC3 TaxID=857293 RepID=I7KWK0_9CLOT|nr:hypothetical protein [Caloramator australicus]CCJ34561.1 hypothetical protein CAAU_2478 [Caloramator australicus RC3]